MAEDFKITVNDPEQAARFQAVFGRTTVKVKSPIPEIANLPGKPNTQIYLLDLDLITPEERARLVQNIAERFGLPLATIEAELDSHGVPILADHCTVTVNNPQRWLT
jgi:hypothetical protein